MCPLSTYWWVTLTLFTEHWEGHLTCEVTVSAKSSHFLANLCGHALPFVCIENGYVKEILCETVDVRKYYDLSRSVFVGVAL